MRRNVVGFLIKLVAILAVFFFSYYFFYLKPKTFIPSKLIEAEDAINNSYLNLKENRLAIFNYSKLDYTSSVFIENKKSNLQKIKETRESGLEYAQKPLSLQKIVGREDEAVAFINSLGERYQKLRKTEEQIFKDQENLINELTETSNFFEKIYIYDAIIDLQTNDIEKDKEDLTERLSRAKSGLIDIKKNLSTNKTNTEVITQIDSVIKDIENLSENLDANDNEGFDISISEYNDHFNEVKNLSFKTETEILTRQTSLEVLKNETNLLLEYESLLNKIRSYKQDYKI